MKVLIIKMSSLGDVVHALPAVRLLAQHLPNARIDWVVEESFQGLLVDEPCIANIIPIAIRRWRKSLLNMATWREMIAFKKHLQATHYDLVIDAQGLCKSALVTAFAKAAIRVGFDKHSAREPLASLVYKQKITVDKTLHATKRQELLFLRALDCDEQQQDIEFPKAMLEHESCNRTAQQQLLFFHGTTWETKKWSTNNWRALAAIAIASGFQVRLPWGSTAEKKIAEEIAAGLNGCVVLPKLSLAACRDELVKASGFVAVDTGLAHWGAALGIPSVSIYGPTDAKLTGTLGHNQLHLVAKQPCAPCRQEACVLEPNFKQAPPCMKSLEPELVWRLLHQLLTEEKR